MATNVMREDDGDNLDAGTQREEELVITEQDPQKAAPEDRDDDSSATGDERIKQGSADDDGSDEGGTDAEREAIRERRRKEKVERKERREQAISRDKLEMDFLRKRNDELERRMSAQEVRAHQADLSTLDQRLSRAQEEVKMAEQVISKAVTAGNGEDVTQAMRYRDEALQRAQQLHAAKAQATRAPAPAEPGIDSQTLFYAKEFLGENKWYDPQGRDEDSAIVLAIDQALVKDGYDPKTEEYWDELRHRAARRLPEHFNAKPKAPAASDRVPRGGPMVSSGREHAPQSTRREVYISPERKQALIDAGVWDDPVLRMKYVKRYSDYDKQNRA